MPDRNKLQRLHDCLFVPSFFRVLSRYASHGSHQTILRVVLGTVFLYICLIVYIHLMSLGFEIYPF